MNKNGLNSYADAAAAIHRSVDSILADPATRTRDLGGSCSTADFTTAIISALRKSAG